MDINLYSLEFFIEKLDVGSPSKVKTSDLQVHLKCSDFVNIQILYFVKSSAYNLKKLGFGKAIVFSSTRTKLISGFNSDFRAIVAESDTPETTVGIAKITWPRDVDSRIKELDKNNDHIQHKGLFNVINKESKTVGTMQVKMCLVYYGGAIEVPIHELGSALSIPLNFRIKMKQENDEWSPMFLAPKKPTKSLMDPSLVFYAQLAGIEPQPPMSALLTPEYINKRLCGHKGCPGAEEFKKFGLGPLATAGSCLGTIHSITNSKPCGLYGMSQAYGTMDNYGAYGLFVKKPTKPKRVCGSPDCPYTIFFGNPDVSSSVVVEDMPKTCQCKNCRKNNSSGSSKQSSTGSSTCGSPKCPKSAPKISNACPESTRKVESTCGSLNCLFSTPKVDNTCEAANCAYNNPILGTTCGNPNCPKSTPKAGITCPYLNKSRLSAGADKYKSECPQTCPYSTYQLQKRQKSTPNSQGSCGGRCPLLPGNYEEPLTAMDGFDKDSFYGESDNSKDILEEIKNCKDKSCPFYVDKNCKDKSCHIYEESDDEYDIGPCGGKVCPLDKQTVSSPEDIFGPYSKKTKRFSLLIDEDGKQILLSAGNGDNQTINCKNLPSKSKELLSTLSPADNSDIFLLISKLAAERKQTNSLKNNFLPSGAGSSGDSTEKKDQSGPCGKDSCKFLKYKTCSECGGVSRTGATCDNTDVSFSTISYDSIAITPVQGLGGEKKLLEKSSQKPSEITSEKTAEIPSDKSSRKLAEKPKPQLKPAVAKKKGDSSKKLKVKIAKERRKNSRFSYIGGEFYPGIILGHKTCVVGARNVPARMGWKWNVKNEGEQKKKKGWKPGVMYKVVEQRIIENRRAKGIPDPPELKMLVKKIKFAGYEVESESEEEEIEPKPTLLIEKKQGNYLITMNPLKDPKTLVPRENPYMRCKPMQFLIVKPKKEAPPIPINSRSQEYEGEDEGEEDFDNFYNPCTCDADSKVLESSSSSESELNIEFTTPAGLINPEDMKRPPNVVNVFTQFLQADFNCEDCAIIIPKKFTKDKKKKGKR